MNTKKLSQQLIALCRSAVRGIAFEGEITDWKGLYAMAHYHGIDGALYYTLHDAVGAENIPSAFDEARARMRHHSITQQHKIRALLQLLEDEGIRAAWMLPSGIQRYAPEEMFFYDECVRACIDPSSLARTDVLLIANGFSLLREQPGCRLYLLSPYFLLALYYPCADASELGMDLGEAMKNAVAKEGYSFIYQMTDSDLVLFHLCDLLRHLCGRGIRIAHVLVLGLLVERIQDEAQRKALEEKLAALHLEPLFKVIVSLFRAWIYGEELTPSLRVLSEFSLGGGMYDDLEDYLRESTGEKPPLAYLFLPYAKMRVAHPFCRSPFLYPMALLARGVRLCLRRKKGEASSIRSNRNGIGKETCRALWRAVGVNIS